MTKDELLTIRLAELKEDVGLVGQMLKKAKKRGDQLTMVSNLVKPVGDGTVGESLTDARSKVELLIINSSGGDDELTAQLEALREDLLEVSKRLRKAADAATVVGERMRDLDSIMETEHRNITDSLYYARDMIKDIERAISGLESDTDQEGAWNAFDELVVKCEPLFTDYVDFLSGVTLRDHGLEDGVATIADRVFKELAVGGIAVPARQGDLPTTLASLARFQFPEWTVWDVPLAGYHAGLSRSSIGESIIDDFHDRHPATFPSKTFGRQLFAEVYAACMVGPAYGYAALLLHLHPRKTQRAVDSPSAADRANVILATLDYYASDDPVVRDQVKRLADRWSFAAGGAAVSDEDAEVFGEFVSLVLSERLDETTRPAPYDCVRWRRATDDVTEMAHIVPGRHVLVLDLLNALWQLRLTDPSAVEGLTAEALISGARPGHSAKSAATSTMQRQARPNETGGLGG